MGASITPKELVIPSMKKKPIQNKKSCKNKQTLGNRAISRKYNGPNIKICGTFLAQFLPACFLIKFRS